MLPISGTPELQEVLFKQIEDVWENVDIYEEKALNISVLLFKNTELSLNKKKRKGIYATIK